MSKLICPFCQQELRKIHPTYVICDNCRITGEDKLWQELIRTRKALDVAVDALKRANNTYCAEEEDITIDLTESAAHKWQRTAYQMEMPISIALEQITALEQKD